MAEIIFKIIRAHLKLRDSIETI